MDVLLMDVDGVLVRPPEAFGLRLLARHPEATRAFFHGPFLACCTGQADLRDHLPALLREIGYQGSVDAFMAEWFESENHPDAALIRALGELRGAGWRVHLATNQERRRLRYLLREMRFAAFLDGDFASCTLGVRKPEPAYFERVTAALPDAGRLVFWDDAPANVEAARAAGWQAQLYTDVAEFRLVMGLPA